MVLHPTDMKRVASLLFTPIAAGPTDNGIAITADDGVTWKLQAFGVRLLGAGTSHGLCSCCQLVWLACMHWQ
jgi:hypothetical protein